LGIFQPGTLNPEPLNLGNIHTMERPLASAAPKVLTGDLDNLHYQKIYLFGVCAFRGICLDFRHPHDL
jgi:hypothetical protein